jgi:putative beta-lysine N-acetyltransferase
MDAIVKIGGSVIQHGKHNNRVYLMKLDPRDSPGIIATLDALAVGNSYSKIFAKIFADDGEPFFNGGYTVEARTPGGYRKDEMLFLAKYFDDNRKNIFAGEVREMNAISKQSTAPPVSFLDGRFQFQKLTAGDAAIMAALYREVFASYPFPIHEPEYLLETMSRNTVCYYGIREQEKLAALSAAEADMDAGLVEMTDFAVLPEYRGNGLALFLLQQMEVDMRARGIKTAYTIARSKSPGMNHTFSGTLINNTNICGSLESMHVWYKKI